MEYDAEHIEIKMIEQAVNLKDKRVLEVGCGDGRVSALLVGKTKELVAIDPDQECIEKARMAVEGVDFRVGSGENLEFEDASFDVVIFTFSLHHQDSQRALREARRILQDSGQLVVLEPLVDGEFQQFFNMFDDETKTLKNALNAIETSDFTLDHREIFDVVATFDNKEDVYNYDFGQDTGNLDEHIIKKIDEQLGAKIHDQPIHLQEKIIIFSLR